MTSSVVAALNKIKDLETFKDEFYFVGGIAEIIFSQIQQEEISE